MNEANENDQVEDFGSQLGTILQPILTQAKGIFYELERFVATKVDRIEFS